MALRAILDTRFYFSYYNPEDEEVAAWSRRLVQSVSRGELEVASSTITVTELYSTMGRIIGKDAVNMRIMSFKASNIAFIPVTEEIAHAAGAIALSTPRTPLADAMIAATALVHAGGAVVTDDEHFDLVNGVKRKWLKKI